MIYPISVRNINKYKKIVSLEYSILFIECLVRTIYEIRTYLQKVKWDLRNYDALKDDVIKNIIRYTFLDFQFELFCNFPHLFLNV